MSTLKVNNIQNASGGSNSTPEQIEQGRAKVWVCFNGTGTVAIRDSFNTSSITDNGTGIYTINFSTALSSTNFCVSGLGSDAQTQFGAYMMDASSNSSYPRTTGSVGVYTLSSQSLLDTTFTNVVVHGDT
tara:strand:- start:193 stop:582 length:390 start_codon:yes stop_codon:yes gene_type:complete